MSRLNGVFDSWVVSVQRQGTPNFSWKVKEARPHMHMRSVSMACDPMDLGLPEDLYIYILNIQVTPSLWEPVRSGGKMTGYRRSKAAMFVHITFEWPEVEL